MQIVEAGFHEAYRRRRRLPLAPPLYRSELFKGLSQHLGTSLLEKQFGLAVVEIIVRCRNR
jgi:hypothetical protein